MMEIIIGFGGILLVALFIYLLGLVPNLWSNCIIDWKSIDEIVNRGLIFIAVLVVIVILLFFFYVVGTGITVLFN